MRRLCWPALALCALLSPIAAGASPLCVTSPDAEIDRYARLVGQNPGSALTAVAPRVDDRSIAPERRAWLYAVQSAAYWALSRENEAKQAAASGLALAPDQRAPVYVQLLIQKMLADFRPEALRSAIAPLEVVRKAQPVGSAEDICLQSAIGDIQRQTDAIEPAIVNLRQSYLASRKPEFAQQRAYAAMNLAFFMRYAGDYLQALNLLQERIAWDRRNGHAHALSADQYYAGRFLRLAGRHEDALQRYTEARELSAPFDDDIGDAYVDLEQCMALIELNRLDEARGLCSGAATVFARGRDVSLGEVRIRLADIALRQQKPSKALSLLDATLDAADADSVLVSTALAYKLRAAAHAALGDVESAYADLLEHQRRMELFSDTERNRQMIAVRAEFEMEREVKRSDTLAHELQMAEDARREQLIRGAFLLALAAGAIAWLGFALVIGRRHRRALEQVASRDALTGLYNRGKAADLSKAVIAGLVHAELAIVLIDLDHFKRINDVYGHAAGDMVLRRFSDRASALLQPSDIIGRWGGEEFLVTLPGVGADTAFDLIEALRAALDSERFEFDADFRVRFSAGIMAARAGENFDDLLAGADAALYRAKRNGRGRTCVHGREAVELAGDEGPEGRFDLAIGA